MDNKKQILKDFVAGRATLEELREALAPGGNEILIFEKKGEKFETKSFPGAWTLEELRKLKKGQKQLYTEIVSADMKVIALTPGISVTKAKFLLT